MPRKVVEGERPKAWSPEISEKRYDLVPEFMVVVPGRYAKTAEERCVRRCDVRSLYPGKTTFEGGDGQRGQKVIASGIGPSFADQTEGSKRWYVVLEVIDNGRDEFLGEIFARRHGHDWMPPVMA